MIIRRALTPFFILLSFIVYTTFGYTMSAPPLRKHNPVRVLVLKDAKEVKLRIKGRYKMVDFKTGEVLKEGKNLRHFTVSIKDINSEGIKILSEGKTRIYINKRQFRGNIDIIKDKDKKLLFVVNHIDVEEYLYGVLYHEVSHRWPIEVLKAQAIVARTYALYEKLVSKNKYFDLVSDVYSQVYGGRTSETWRTTKAVNLTIGQVLTYNGKIFPTYYHATCGGQTSSANTLWNIDIPTLCSRVCDFCKHSPHYKWKKELKAESIEKKLKDGDHKIKILSIEALKRDPSGRILDIFLEGEDNSVKLSGNKFRLIVGPNVIRSTNFEVMKKGKYFTFQGKGWGHGIGMCQWGAYGMSKKGWDVGEILEYYYPDSELVKWEQE